MADPPRPPRPLPPPGLAVGPCPSPPRDAKAAPKAAPPKAPSPTPKGALPEDGRFRQLSDDEKRSVAELAQLERAMAALDGRSVDGAEDTVLATLAAERRERALGDAIERGQAAIAVRRRTLPLRIAGAVLALGAASAGLFFLGKALLARSEARASAERALDEASAPLARSGFGFERVASGLAGEEAEATVARGRCYVALATDGAGAAGRVTLAWRGQTSEGRSVGFCACGAGTALARAASPGGSARILAAPAGPLGGPDLFAASLGAARPELALGESVDRACAEEGLDALLSTARAAPAKSSPEEAAGHADRALLEAGLRPAGRSPAGQPFVRLEGGGAGGEEKETCWLARPQDASARLSLRLPGGARPIGPLPPGSALVACLGGSGASVWREGAGEIAVFSAPRRRIGGTLGALEIAGRAGLGARAFAPAGALAADAAALLVASGLPAEMPGDEAAAARGEAGAPAFAAFSADPEGVPPSAPRGALCRPEPGEGASRGFCALAPGADRQAVAAALGPGHALARRPAWLISAGGAERPAHLELLALSRRLAARGFELTTLVGASPTPGGAEVVGRSGEREIVAVAVGASPPFVHPLSDGAAWPVSGEPRIVALAAGQTARLRAHSPLGGGRREILVWRR